MAKRMQRVIIYTVNNRELSYEYELTPNSSILRRTVDLLRLFYNGDKGSFQFPDSEGVQNALIERHVSIEHIVEIVVQNYDQAGTG